MYAESMVRSMMDAGKQQIAALEADNKQLRATLRELRNFLAAVGPGQWQTAWRDQSAILIDAADKALHDTGKG